MKLRRFSIFVVITIAAYIFNHYYLEIKPFAFTGIYLGLVLFVGFIGLYVGKLYKKKKGIPQEPHAYALPDIMARVMKNVDMRTQYESSILSMFFIMVGMIAFTIYLVFLTDFSLIFKILTAFNSFFGIIFMLSYLVTTYQQYISYMETQTVMEDIIRASPGGNPEIIPTIPGLPKPQLTLPDDNSTDNPNILNAPNFIKGELNFSDNPFKKDDERRLH